jgi:cation-dependent mannose-6-phosphate receptor
MIGGRWNGPGLRDLCLRSWNFIHHSIAITSIIYLLFHTLYNRFILGYRGWDQLPHPSIPSFQFPSMNFFQQSRSSPSWGSWRRGGYGHVGAVDPDDDEGQGFAGRFSLEDDEADQDARALAGDPSVWRDVGRGGGGGGGQESNGQSGHQRQSSDPLLHL